MKRRLALVVVSALVVLGAFTFAASLIPSRCANGWHKLPSGGCETDATHLAPSSGVPIPDAMMFQADERWSLRYGIILVGIFLAGGIVWVGVKRHPDHQPPVAATGSAR